MSKEAKIFLGAVVAFSLAEFVGGGIFHLMRNENCFRFLGCNAGFFGYDALVHFLAGIMEMAFLFWLRTKLKKDFLHGIYFYDMAILVAFLALMAVSWELVEFCFDQFRLYVLHVNLLVPNHLAQPSNADTMGDMFFSIFSGKLAAVYFLKSRLRKA